MSKKPPQVKLDRPTQIAIEDELNTLLPTKQYQFRGEYLCKCHYCKQLFIGVMGDFVCQECEDKHYNPPS